MAGGLIHGLMIGAVYGLGLSSRPSAAPIQVTVILRGAVVPSHGPASAPGAVVPRLEVAGVNTREALAGSEQQRLQALVANIPGAVFRCQADEHWTMEFLSDAIEEITGYPASDFIGNRVRSYASITHPDDSARVGEHIMAAIDAGLPYAIDYRILNADGEVRWLWEKGQGVRGPDGEVCIDGVFFDVTERKREEEERKRIEQSLSDAELRYRTLVEQLPLVAYINGTDENIPVVFISPQIESIIGYRPEEMLVDPEFFAKVLHPEDRERVLAEHADTFETGEPLRTEYRVVARDGRVVWFQDEGTILETEDGSRILHGFLLDVTERHRAEAERRAAEAKYRTLVEHLPVVTYTVGLESGFPATFMSPQMEALVGYSAEECTADPQMLAKLLHPDDREVALAAHARTLETGEPLQVEYRFIARDGRTVWIHDEAVLIRNDAGEPLALQGCLLDITDRKLAEAGLRESHERFRIVAQTTDCAIYDWEVDSGTVLWTEGLTTAFGYPPAEAAESYEWWLEHVHPDDRERIVGEISTGLAEADEYSCEYRFRAENGSYLSVWDRGKRVRGAGGSERVIGGMADVSAHKEAEGRLHEAEARYRTLVEHLPLVTYVDKLGEHCTSLYLSPQFENMLGYSVEEWMSDPELFARALHPDDRDAVLAETEQAWEALRSWVSEYRLIARDGRTVWVRDQGGVVRDDDGEPIYSLGFYLDITARKEAEEGLREAEARYRTLVEQLPLVVYMDNLDDASSNIYTSPQTKAMLGYSPEDWKNDPDLFVRALHPDDRVRVLGEYAKGQEVGEDSYSFEYRLIASNGRVVWVRDEGVILRDAEGRQSHAQGCLLDITERKEAEEELRVSEARFRSYFENASIGMALTTPDGRFVRVNPALCELVGYSERELLSKTFQEITHSDDLEANLAVVAATLAGEQASLELEKRYVHKDGREIWVLVTSSPVRDAAGRPMMMITQIQDVTGRKLAQEEREQLLRTLSEQNERLLELDRLKDEFVALVSHELRTPLTSIRGYLELVLEGETGELTDDQAHFLEVVERNAERLQRLVGDLLFVAQMEAGRINLSLQSVDLTTLAEEGVEAATPAAESKGVGLRLEAEPVPALNADRARLAQVLDNLVSNAIKFTPDGGSVDVRVRSSNGSVVLEVSDTGMGVPADEQGRLFERFYRTSAATTQAIQGTGLGLAITKAIVQAHQGEISLESEEGVGTTIRVVLPGSAEVTRAA